jgi:hypothetical protein
MKTALRETIPKGGGSEEGKRPRAEPPRVGQLTLTKVVTGQRRVGKAWGCRIRNHFIQNSRREK